MRDRITREIMPETEERLEPRFPDDYAFAQRLVAGGNEVWNEHLRQWKARGAAYIERRYPALFNDSDKENIQQEMEVRLLKDDRKCLRDYRGMQSLSKHIEQQLEWAILTELRKRAIDFLATDEYDDEENDKTQDSDHAGNDTAEEPEEIGPKSGFVESEIPQCLTDIPDKQRWVYLLRYYDDFGFPDSEIILLAKNRKMAPEKLSKLIADLLEPTGQDLLAGKREDFAAVKERIDRCLAKIYFLSLEQRKLARDIDGDIMGGVDISMVRERLADVDQEISRVRQRLERAIAEKGDDCAIETPYEIIGKILGEENMNTLRGRLLSAKKKLAERLLLGNKEQKPEKRRLN